MAGSQLDLIGDRPLTIRPALGRDQPRLWVRRLAVWSEPGVKIRDIPLYPGLNVIWSPDGADDPVQGVAGPSIGHGSGKTLFCRLLRYCLGEDRFATEDQRDRIGHALPEGLVGAEVVVDGQVWAVLRPLGSRRRHVAVAGGDLDDIAAGNGAITGMAPFLDAATERFVPADVAALIPGHADHGHGWLVALAWASRDQECRFGDALAWRDASSGSDSPVRDWSKTLRADAVRAFLGALDPDEQALRGEEGRLEAEKEKAGHRASHLAWEAEQLHRRLRRELGLGDADASAGDLDVEGVQKAARARLQAVGSLPEGTGRVDIPAAREEFERHSGEATRLSAELSAVAARAEEVEKTIPMIKGEIPSLSYEQYQAGNVLCPICEVPVDRVLAAKCGISEKLPDLAAAKQRYERRVQDLKDAERRLEDLSIQKRRIAAELGSAEQRVKSARERLAALEAAAQQRTSEWYSAQRLAEDAEHLAGLQLEAGKQRRRHDALQKDIEDARSRRGVFRERQQRAQKRLGELFDGTVRRLLVGQAATGHVQFSAQGLGLSVHLGGDRSTAAIESLKVIAFDLAVLCLAIEGRISLPGFLVHDSPREADLGLTHYHEVFRLAHFLQGDRPLFQYIVTTTTAPPAEFRAEPWLRLKLRGAPAAERLLGRDL